MGRVGTGNSTWGDILECCFKAQSSKLERLFSSKRGKRDVRALSFELSKMTPQVGLAVLCIQRERQREGEREGGSDGVMCSYAQSYMRSMVQIFTERERERERER